MQKILLPILILAFTACNQNQIISPVIPSNPRGLVEVNFSQINNANPSSSAKNIISSAASPTGASLAARRNQNRNLSDNGGGIDMKLLSTTAFTFNPGVNRQDGFRYLSATYKIRNADRTGTPYSTPRNNLSFVAVSTPGTVGSTAVSSLLKFDGSPADPSIAPMIRPTHEMILDKYALFPVPHDGGQDFQAFSEAEIAKFQPGGTDAIPGVSSVFGYGFVTQAIGETLRTLPAAPTKFPDGYDGIITFAVRVPLQAGPNGESKDPFSFSMMFEVMDDDQTTVSQSLEELTNPSNLLSRASSLGSVPIKTLPGSVYQGTPICSIRTAGTVANPLAFMVNSSKLSGTPALANQMFAPIGGNINVGFDQTMNAASSQSFSVYGSMTGSKTGTYDGAGTNTLGFVPTDSSSAAFPPNEDIEVSLHGGLNSVAGLGFCPNYTFKYRTKVNVPSTADFPTNHAVSTGNLPLTVASSDINHDGKIDLITLNLNSSDVNIMLGNGDGTFQNSTSLPVGGSPSSLAVYDLNHDHNIDIMTTSLTLGTVTILLGNDAGGFTSSEIGFSTFFEFYPISMAVTDFNNDGFPDIITANGTKFSSGSVSVFLGYGDGKFQTSLPTVMATNNNFNSVSTNDLNNDGKMDVILGNYDAGIVTVLLGKGDGGFQNPQSMTLHGVASSVTTSDVNNDGKIDLVTTDVLTGANEISISLGNGDGTFKAASYKPVGSNPLQVITADLNGDGKLDIASADSAMSQITILIGNSDGTFQDGNAMRVLAAPPQSLSAADLNNDGKLDLASTNSVTNSVLIFLQ